MIIKFNMFNILNQKILEKKTVSQLLLCAFSFFIYFLITFWEDSGLNSCLVIVSALNIIVLSLYLVIEHRNNIFLFLIFLVLLYSNYSIVFTNYLIEDMFYAKSFFISYFYGEIVKYNALKIMLLFMILLVLFINKIGVNISTINLIQKKNYNFKLAFILIIIAMLISVYGFTRPNEVGERGAPSTIYEYTTILFIIILYFSGNFKIILLPTILVLFFTSVQNMVYGGRVTALQLILILLFMCYYQLLTYKKMIFYIFLIFIIMVPIGIMRANVKIGLDTLSLVSDYLSRTYWTWDTAYSAYHTSLAILNTEELVEASLRLKVFIQFIIQQLLGGSITEFDSLHSVVSQYHKNYGGCILPFYFHFMLGTFGVFTAAYIVAFYCNMIASINSDSSGLKQVLSCYIAVTSFRWYLYSPFQLIRGVIILSVCWYIIRLYIHVDSYIYKTSIKIE